MDSLKHTRAAQSHLTQFQAKYDTSILDWERQHSHATVVPENPEYPDVYVNGEDLTVTVDPYKNAHWIRDSTWRSAASIHRGALKDHQGVLRAQAAINKPYLRSDLNLPPETFIPTTSMFDNLPKFTTKCNGNSTRGEAKYERPGELPAIEQLKYWGLPEKYSKPFADPDRTRFHEKSGPIDIQMDRGYQLAGDRWLKLQKDMEPLEQTRITVTG